MDGIATLAGRVRKELTGNILPFWSSVPLDHERGGFHGRVDNDLSVDDGTERTAVLCARVLWTFAAAARRLGAPELLATAHHAHRALRTQFTDPEYGGVFWSVDAAGRVVNDRKQTYAQAFALYGLAEYARATGDAGALASAWRLFGLIEEHTADGERGGYVEARGRDWGAIDDVRLSPKDLNAPKSMNTLLHVMEAYTTFWEVTGSDEVRGRLGALVSDICDHVVAGGRFLLFFDHDWVPLSQVVSYGHDIEGAWLLVAAARAAGDDDLVRRAEEAALAMAAAVLAEGRDGEGAVLYERDADEVDRASHWWAQAEGAVGFLCAHELSGDGRYLAAAASCWDVIERHHVDHEHGDWFKVVDAERRPRPDTPKAGPWECPYHHVRACLELIERLPAPTEKEM